MRYPSGHLVVEKLTDGSTSYAARFRWEGRRYYRSIGTSRAGMDKRTADREMKELIARVIAGVEPPSGRSPEPERPEVTFADLAAELYERMCLTGGRDGKGLSKSGRNDLDWSMRHVVGWFGDKPVNEVTAGDVERFAVTKQTKGGLSPASVRRMVRLVRNVLQLAVRDELVARNVADEVRVKVPAYRGTALTSAAEFVALLDAARGLDEAHRSRRGHARPLLATLALAGLRIDEALSLRWKHIDLTAGPEDAALGIAGRIKVERSKTDAGEREVDLLLPLREELVQLKLDRNPDSPEARVFGTSLEPTKRKAATAALDADRAAHKAKRTDATRAELERAEDAYERCGKESPSNVRRRYLTPAAEDASAALVAAGREALPHLTPHSLRRSFASLLVAIGRDPLYVAAQLGHTDPTFSLRVYARVVRLRENERDQLRALAAGDALTLPDLDRIARPQEPVAA